MGFKKSLANPAPKHSSIAVLYGKKLYCEHEGSLTPRLSIQDFVLQLWNKVRRKSQARDLVPPCHSDTAECLSFALFEHVKAIIYHLGGRMDIPKLPVAFRWHHITCEILPGFSFRVFKAVGQDLGWKAWEQG